MTLLSAIFNASVIIDIRHITLDHELRSTDSPVQDMGLENDCKQEIYLI